MSRASRAAIWFSALLCVVASACAPVVKPAGPALVEPLVNADTIVADDGATLPLRSWLPDAGQPSAVVLGVPWL